MHPLASFTIETVDAISALVKNNLYNQALIILYSAIDTLAWSELTSESVKHSDFCNWVDNYMNPEYNLGCSALELYAARCGLVHSGTAKSDLSRRHQARELWYVTSPASKSVLTAIVADMEADAHVIYFTDLLAVFISASESYQNHLTNNRSMLDSVNRRIQNWMRFIRLEENGEKTSITNEGT